MKQRIVYVRTDTDIAIDNSYKPIIGQIFVADFDEILQNCYISGTGNLVDPYGASIGFYPREFVLMGKIVNLDYDMITSHYYYKGIVFHPFTFNKIPKTELIEILYD